MIHGWIPPHAVHCTIGGRRQDAAAGGGNQGHAGVGLRPEPSVGGAASPCSWAKWTLSLQASSPASVRFSVTGIIRGGFYRWRPVATLPRSADRSTDPAKA